MYRPRQTEPQIALPASRLACRFGLQCAEAVDRHLRKVFGGVELAVRRFISRRNATSKSEQTACICKPRLEDGKQWILVLIGATSEGRKEFIGSPSESAQDQRGLPLDLKRRGLNGPQTRDWRRRTEVAGEIWPAMREQRVESTRPRTCSPSCRRANSRRPNVPAGDLDGRDEG